MKNKNTLVITALIGFIIVYQMFVINPYNKENQPKEQKTASDQNFSSTSQTQTPSTTSSGTTNSIENTNNGQMVSAELTNDKSLQKMYLSPKRTIHIYEKAVLGTAMFNDYKVRNRGSEKAVSFLENGLFWRSNNPRVQKCLSSLNGAKVRVEDRQSEFSAKTDGVTCQAKFARVEGKEGVISTQLILSTDKIEKGVVEFVGTGSLHSDRPMEERFKLGYKIGDSVDWERDEDVLESTVFTGSVEWVSWGDKYFTAIFAPKGSLNPNVIKGTASEELKTAYYGLQYPVLAQSGTPTTYDFDLYVGTRDPDILSANIPVASDALDYGWLTSISKWILFILKKINVYTNNFGLSIILLTLFIRLSFWPLNKKVYVSGLKMKQIQPQVAKLKEKYGNDKAKAFEMQQEMMRIYKENKVNPMGSCLPLLLQMPIFFSLFGALRNSIDLYQSPFFAWIQDLSSPDPFYVYPVLWTVSLILMMKLNPQTSVKQPGMPDMKLIFYGMNVFFGFLSKDWPAGLLLYLIVTNVVGIVQQYMMRRYIKLETVQEGV